MTITAQAKFLLLLQALLFALGSLVHGRVLLDGYGHRQAATAEGVIAAVLFVGFVACLIRPAASYTIALGVQGFALLGTVLGAVLIAVGIGPRSTADVVFHAILLIALVAGIAAVMATPRGC